MSETEKWAERVKEFRESGKSQRVWSAEQGIKRSTLRYWLKRTEELSEAAEVRFELTRIEDDRGVEDYGIIPSDEAIAYKNSINGFISSFTMPKEK